MHVIEVLGTGCSNCLKLELASARAAEQAHVEVEIHQVTNTRRIRSYGVIDLPGLVIDGRVASTGRVPELEEISDWLLPAGPTRRRQPE